MQPTCLQASRDSQEDVTQAQANKTYLTVFPHQIVAMAHQPGIRNQQENHTNTEQQARRGRRSVSLANHQPCSEHIAALTLGLCLCTGINQSIKCYYRAASHSRSQKSSELLLFSSQRLPQKSSLMTSFCHFLLELRFVMSCGW